jgi:hypothetical protein
MAPRCGSPRKRLEKLYGGERLGDLAVMHPTRKRQPTATAFMLGEAGARS